MYFLRCYKIEICSKNILFNLLCTYTVLVWKGHYHLTVQHFLEFGHMTCIVTGTIKYKSWPNTNDRYKRICWTWKYHKISAVSGVIIPCRAISQSEIGATVHCGIWRLWWASRELLKGCNYKFLFPNVVFYDPSGDKNDCISGFSLFQT